MGSFRGGITPSTGRTGSVGGGGSRRPRSYRPRGWGPPRRRQLSPAEARNPSPQAPAAPARTPQQVSAPKFTAQVHPALSALGDRYTEYLDDYMEGTGHALDVLGGRIRDAREGGRRSLAASEGLRGIKSSNRMAQYEAETQGDMAKAMTDAALRREESYGGAMRGGLPIYQAPGQMAMAEKGLGLSAWQAANQANQWNAAQQHQVAQDEFANFLAMLQAQRTSPVYTGMGGY